MKFYHGISLSVFRDCYNPETKIYDRNKSEIVKYEFNFYFYTRIGINPFVFFPPSFHGLSNAKKEAIKTCRWEEDEIPIVISGNIRLKDVKLLIPAPITYTEKKVFNINDVYVGKKSGIGWFTMGFIPSGFTKNPPLEELLQSSIN